MNNSNELKSFMEQYIENGGHISELMECIPILSAIHKTPLGLSQWTSSDKPVIEYFNEDNRIIDEKMRELLAGIDNLEEKITRHGDVYDGVDLTAKFSTEIADHSSVWAWIKARIQAADWNGIHVGDYIPFTCTNGYEIKAEVAGIDTYYNYGDSPVPHHIDFISRDCWPDTHVWNKADYNNGTTVSPYPWLASDIYAFLNSLSMSVPNSATANPTLVNVNYTTTGVYDKLPTSLKEVIITKRAYLPQRYTAGSWLVDDNLVGWTDAGKLWLPSEVEVIGRVAIGTISNQDFGGIGFKQYPIFANNMKQVKLISSSGGRASWWLMSTRANNNTNAAIVYNNGISAHQSLSRTNVYVPVCFRIA